MDNMEGKEGPRVTNGCKITDLALDPAKLEGNPVDYPLPKRGGIDETPLEMINMASVKYNKNSAKINMQSGSTVPLMETAGELESASELRDYNPFEHRMLTHPTSDMDTLIHLLKGSLGSGILAMPMAIRNSGLVFGVVATFAVGIICTYCIHVLVKTSQHLCRANMKPSLGYAETAEMAFRSSNSTSVQKYCRLAKATINLFLVLDLLGCCCVYVLFVSKNIKQVIDFYTDGSIDLRIYMVALLPFLILINLIRNLKHLAPLSMIANILIFVGMAITFYYMLTDLPPISERPKFTEVSRLPSFFGTVIFALEGIGVVMPLENNMKNPQNFIGWGGVLNYGMSFVVTMYALTGFVGFWKYGDLTEDSITLNLPQHEILAQTVKVMIAVAIFFTYSLQFYVPMEIIWKNVTSHVRMKGGRKLVAEYAMRVTLVTATVVLSIILPNLGPFITLIGAVCLSTLGLMFPAIIETVTFWGHQDYRESKLWIAKNLFLVCFGMVGLVTGTMVSIHEFSQ